MFTLRQGLLVATTLVLVIGGGPLTEWSLRTQDLHTGVTLNYLNGGQP